MSDKQPPKTYLFENFKLETSKKLLLSVPRGEVVALTHKAYEVLKLLIENAGSLVTKDELMETVWKDSVVEEANLTQTISVLRKTLGENAQQHRFIVTETGQGYRFVAEIEESDSSDEIFETDSSDTSSDPDSKAQPSVNNRLMPKTVVYPIALLLFAIIIFGAYRFWSTSENPTSKNLLIKDVKAIAVLPFNSLDSENSDNLLGIGMADAVITKLSQTKTITVRQTSSVLRYADTTPEAIKVGREINVDAVLEGKIQKADGRIRVSVRMYRVSDGSLLWAESFDEQETGIFKLQDSISEKIASSLTLELDQEERNKLKHRYTENIEAYNLYNKGRFFWNNRNEEDLRKSIKFFEQAIEKDKNYALAYAGVAESYVLLHTYSSSQEKNAFPKAKLAAEKALSLDDNLAQAHTALAMYQEQYQYDWSAAEKEFEKAIGANPSYATARQWFAEFLGFLGKTEESIAEAEKAFGLDPLSLSTNTARAFPYLAARKYDKAIEKLKPALELDGEFPLALYYLGRCYDGKGLHKKAITEYNKALNSSGGGTYFRSALIYALYKDGQKAAADVELKKIEKLSEQRSVSKYVLARSYAAVNEKEKALKTLEEAYQERDSLMIVMNIEQIFDEIRGEPRFQALMKKMNL